MAIATGNKREHLRRAKDLLASGQPYDLRYAALELRLCLEAMTYEKLSSFAKYLPPSFVARTWQPPKLLKAMKQFDASADKSFELYMGGPAVPGVPPTDTEFKFVGKHRAFELTWLEKCYHKLGSFLHLQENATTGPPERRAFMMKLTEEIEEAQAGSILSMCFADTTSFLCELCEQQVIVSTYFARTQRRATCLNASCEAEFTVKVDGDHLSFAALFARLTCKDCGAEMIVQGRHLKQDLVLPCPMCKRRHGFRCHWTYGVIPKAERQ